MCMHLHMRHWTLTTHFTTLCPNTATSLCTLPNQNQRSDNLKCPKLKRYPNIHIVATYRFLYTSYKQTDETDATHAANTRPSQAAHRSLFFFHRIHCAVFSQWANSIFFARTTWGRRRMGRNIIIKLRQADVGHLRCVFKAIKPELCLSVREYAISLRAVVRFAFFRT